MSRIDIDVLKELKIARDMIQDCKKRLSDFTDGKDAALHQITDDLENAICEESEGIESALADIENALCELTEE